MSLATSGTNGAHALHVSLSSLLSRFSTHQEANLISISLTFSPADAFRRCCNSQQDTVVLASPLTSFTSLESGDASTSYRSPTQMFKRQRESDVEAPKELNDQGDQRPSPADSDSPSNLRAVAMAIRLSPAPGRSPIPVAMLCTFVEDSPHAAVAQGSMSSFLKVVQHVGGLVTAGMERSANNMRREKELLAQQALISMKRFVSGEMPTTMIADESGALGMSIFSQAATSIRAILNAHACVIWDTSCFRLFSLASSTSSNKSDPLDGEDSPSTWSGWKVRTSVQEGGDEKMPESPLLHKSPSGSLGKNNSIVVAETIAEPSSMNRVSTGDIQLNDQEDLASADGWTCSFPVTDQPVSVIGSSGGSMAHFKNLDGVFSRPKLAEFFATTRELGYHSRAQAEGEHIKTTEASLFGETSSLAQLLPPCCHGLLAVPIFETDDQPAFMILAAFDEKPVFESADRHFVEQVGSLLLTWSIRARVKAVDRAQAQFIQRIQHELRTPLHAVIGTLDVLRETIKEGNQGTSDKLTEGAELGALVDSAAVSADALNKMINNILDFGALKAMPVHANKDESLPCVRWSEICAVVSETCVSEWTSTRQSGEIFNPAAEAEGLSGALLTSKSSEPTSDPPELLFDFDAKDVTGDMLASVDLEAIETVVRKLVNNSIRATRSGSITVGLRISGGRPTRSDKSTLKQSRSAPRDTRHFDVEITVEDTGKGMRREFIESHLFAPYAKEDTFLPGSGLSLAIASRLVHRMGGHVSVVSSVDVGTKFTIILPVRFGHKKGVPSTPTSIALLNLASAMFVGFDTPALIRTKELICARIVLDETENVSDAKLLFVTSEATSSAAFRDNLSIIAELGDREAPHVIVLSREEPQGLNESSQKVRLDAILQEYALDSRLAARVFMRPIDFKIYSHIEMIKERVMFNSAFAPLTATAGSSTSDGAGMETHSSVESPCLATPVNQEPDGISPFVETEGDKASQASPWHDHLQRFSACSTPEQRRASIQATVAELAVEPATLQEVKDAADSLRPTKDFVVMVVEDNPLNMKIMTTMLDRAKINYIQAWNGKEAVDMFKEHLPEVVLLDITMPIMDGFQACAEIRKFRPGHLVRDDGSPCHRISECLLDNV